MTNVKYKIYSCWYVPAYYNNIDIIINNNRDRIFSYLL